MKFRFALAISPALVLLLAGCTVPPRLSERDERLITVKRPAMAEKVIQDVVPLPAEKKPDMWDIAQTFPAYDWSINAFHRDGFTQQDDHHFLLMGDGSQTPVEIRHTQESKDMKVEVTIGPIHDGYGFRKPKLHYTFTRVKGGWKRQNWNVTYHGPPRGDGKDSPPLSEQENRAKIEKITGKPYVDELEIASTDDGKKS